MKGISIIVSIYNQAEYLDECIESIVNQTYKNIEIILVNDGSSDNSLEICNKYKNIDDRIVIIDKENGGLSSARNSGLDIASGKYIMFCDADDYYFPNTCQILYNLIDNNNCDFAIGNYINCCEDSTLWKKPIFDKEIYKDFKLSINDYDKSFYVMSSSVCNKIFRREFIDKYNLRFIVGVPAEDAIFTTYCFIKANSTYYTSDVIYSYRQRNAGTSISTNNNLKYFTGISKAYRYIYNNFNDNGELGFYRYFYLKTLFYIMYKFIDSKVMNDNDKRLALGEIQWFTRLSLELGIKYDNSIFFEIIRLINDSLYDEAIEKCMEVSKIRLCMSEEDKLKMSKIPPLEYHNYI